MTDGRGAPALTALLGLLPPGEVIPDPHDLEIVALSAVETGLIETDGIRAAADALGAASRGADGREGAGRVLRRCVRLAAPDLARLVDEVLAAGYPSSILDVSLGPMPPEAEARVACAGERPAIASILRRSTIDHLVAWIMDVCSRLPGARLIEDAQGSVVEWSCAARDRGELDAACAWMSLPGPGALPWRDCTVPSDQPDRPRTPPSVQVDAFALVLRGEEAGMPGGRRAFATITVGDEGASVGFFDDIDEARRTTAGLRHIAIGDGGPGLAIVPFAMEMEAISILADAVASGTDELQGTDARRDEVVPRDFVPVIPPCYGDLTVTIDQHGIDLFVGERLAGGLGWRQGDRIALAQDASTRRLLVFRSMDGPEMDAAMDGLETSHTLPLPLELAPVANRLEIQPPYLIIAPGSLLLSTELLTHGKASSPSATEEDDAPVEPPSTRPRRASPKALLGAALSGFALGTLGTVAFFW